MKFSSSFYAGAVTAILSATAVLSAPAESLEVRQSPISALGAVVSAYTGVATIILDQVNKDKEERSAFTQKTIEKMAADYPGWNYVMCHTDHSAKFDGVQGTDWDHRHEEYDVTIGGTVGYEIYFGKGGTFELNGDGGYLNWAYRGEIVSDSGDDSRPRIVTFGNPQD